MAGLFHCRVTAAHLSSRAPRAGCSRKHRSTLTSFRIFTVWRSPRYIRLLAAPCGSYAGKKPVRLLRRHSGAVQPSPALAWPCYLLLQICCWNQYVSLKKGKILQMLLFAPSLSCKNSALKKTHCVMKTPDGKMKECVVVTDHEQ